MNKQLPRPITPDEMATYRRGLLLDSRVLFFNGVRKAQRIPKAFEK